MDSVLSCANASICGDIWSFWDAEVPSFATGEHSFEKYLDLLPWPHGLGELVATREEVRKAADKAHNELAQGFVVPRITSHPLHGRS